MAEMYFDSLTSGRALCLKVCKKLQANFRFCISSTLIYVVWTVLHVALEVVVSVMTKAKVKTSKSKTKTKAVKIC